MVVMNRRCLVNSGPIVLKAGPPLLAAPPKCRRRIDRSQLVGWSKFCWLLTFFFGNLGEGGNVAPGRKGALSSATPQHTDPVHL